MEKNLLLDMIRFYDICGLDEKKLLLQNLEHEFSLEQKRKEREIILTTKDIYHNKYIFGLFNSNSPDILTIKDVKYGKYREIENTGLFIFDTLYHEGKHSAIYDFKKGYSDLLTIDSISKKNLILKIIADNLAFKIWESNKSSIDQDIIIYNNEEEFVSKETAMYIIYQFLKSCNTSTDCEQIFEDYKKVLIDYLEEQKSFIKNRPFQTELEPILFEIKNNPSVDSVTPKNVLRQFNSDTLVDCFNSSINILQQKRKSKDKIDTELFDNLSKSSLLIK